MSAVRRSTRLSSISKAIEAKEVGHKLPDCDEDEEYVQKTTMSASLKSTRTKTSIKASTQSKDAWRKVRHIDDSDEDEEEENLQNFNLNTPMPRPKKKQTAKSNTATKNTTTRSAPKRAAISKTHELNESSSEDSDNSVHASPPKQNKIQKDPLNLFSPTRLLDRLSVEDRADESSAGKQQELKRSKYQNARRVLNSAETNVLPGREKELDQLYQFLINNLNSSMSGSLYVSGQPGTGKTACLFKLLKTTEFSSKFTKIYINCTSISSVGSIYKKICDELKLKVQGRTEKDHLAAINSHLNSHHKMILMVLDEIDQLCSSKQSVLYTIFEWPAIPNSKLLLVGIANSLDLTDRMLMRLNAKCDLKPRLIHFAPYTKQQIVDIFKSRLEEAGVLDVFPAVTIQLLAAKVSAISGDVRRALDIGRRVVEIAEQQKNNSGAVLTLKEFGIDASKEQEFKPVQVNQVVTVLNSVYGASQNLNDDIEDGFPLQQKIMLCCLMMMLRKEKNKDITMGRLHDVYKRVCAKRNILPVDQAEFAGCGDLVETRGIIRIIHKKEPRLNKVQLQWDEEEVNAALCDKQLIASILDDTSCLTR